MAEILDMAVRLEKNGEKVYRDAISILSNKDLADTLAWMADEEIKHAEWFARLKQDLGSRAENDVALEMGGQLLKSLMGEQAFSLKEIDFSRVGTQQALISIFIEFERDTILFYEMLQPFITDAETLKGLHAVISEEKKHIDQLRAFSKAGGRISPQRV